MFRRAQARSQHGQGAHAPIHRGLWRDSIVDGLPFDRRQQRFVRRDSYKFEGLESYIVFLDYLIVGSDSGRIVILEYNGSKNRLDRVQMETFGKSGCRRIVPGQYLAVDPKGRAVMIGALEKQKLVYILNRDSQARLTISSPLEAHKSSTFIFHIVGVDVGFENPLFACLEVDYEEADNDITGISSRSIDKGHDTNYCNCNFRRDCRTNTDEFDLL